VSILAQQELVGPAGAVLFYAIALLITLSAWAIVLSQNIVRISVYLLLTLVGAAALYLLMGAEFLAAIQLVVYAGGTLILIVFGVMLTSKNPFMQLRVQLWEMFVGIFIGILIAALLIFAMVRSASPQPLLAQGHRGGYGDVSVIGRALLSSYVVPFEIAAVLLLVVMIAAAFMARQRAD